MSTNQIANGVGKRIVDALKQQANTEIQNITEASEEVDNNIEFNFEDEISNEPSVEFQSQFNQKFTKPETLKFNQQPSGNDLLTSDLDDFEIPTNVAVLKNLINQLPAGVSKQTGAQIIKQTMEALGIPMKSVLQEAQQVQDSLNNSTRECQSSIVEHRKQIGLLERQAQKFQRQYAALNDVISLFVQTNI